MPKTLLLSKRESEEGIHNSHVFLTTVRGQKEMDGPSESNEKVMKNKCNDQILIKMLLIRVCKESYLMYR